MEPGVLCYPEGKCPRGSSGGAEHVHVPDAVRWGRNRLACFPETIDVEFDGLLSDQARSKAWQCSAAASPVSGPPSLMCDGYDDDRVRELPVYDLERKPPQANHPAV